MTGKPPQFVGGAPLRGGGNGEVRCDWPRRLADARKTSIRSPQGEDSGVPRVRGRGETGGFGALTRANYTTLLTRGQPVSERGGNLARRRYQKGQLLLREKRWVLRWREDVIENGQLRRVRRSEVIGTLADYPTERLARRAADARLVVVNDSRYRARPTATFAELAVRWESAVLPMVKPSTRINYRSHLRKHLVPFFGSFQMKDIQPELVQRFLAGLRAGPKTVRNVYITLRSLWRSARSWGYVAHDAVEGVVLPRAFKSRRLFYSLAEVRKIIVAAEGPYCTFFWLKAETGMRAGEVCGLTWDDLGLEQGMVSIHQSAWQGRLQSPKSEQARRSVLLSPQLVGHLRGYLESWRPNELRLLFATRNGTPWESKKPRQVLRKLTARLGIPWAGLHGFRHANETLMDRMGAPLKVRQQRLGHSDARITLDVYTHAIGEDHRRVAAKLGSVLDPLGPKSPGELEADWEQVGMIQ